MRDGRIISSGDLKLCKDCKFVKNIVGKRKSPEEKWICTHQNNLKKSKLSGISIFNESCESLRGYPTTLFLLCNSSGIWFEEEENEQKDE